MQARSRILLPVAAALALPLSGCLSASNGLDYRRPDSGAQPTPFVSSMNGTRPGQSGWPTGQLPIPGEPLGYTPSPVKPAPPPAPPPPPPCQAPGPGQAITLEGCKPNDVLILRGVNFEFDKDRLTLNAQAILDQVAEALQARPDIKVEIDGHTDGKGTVAYNQKLSERRAASVKKYLVGKGIDSARMTSAGFGKSRPIADNSTDEGRALNRRVELKVTETRPGAAPVTTAPMTVPTTAPAGAVAPPTSSSVSIIKFSFTPDTITVPAGSTVTWTNQDADTPHIVKFADSASAPLKQGASYSKTFATPGVYTYQCGVHPYMTGKVVVQ
jgi:OOP family OmpA-OmpF porin